jgi:hypothetical protein
LWGFGFKLGAFAVGFFALGAIGLVAAGVALGNALSGPWGFGFEVQSPPPRPRLRPIPISATACPAVKQIHDAANQFQLFFPLQGAAAADGRFNDWPRERQQLGQAADRLTFTLAYNESRFPPAVREQMQIVLADLKAGRAQLTNAHDPVAFVVGVEPENGWNAFGDASDLIGKQCSGPLAADNWTMATTTTVR